MIGEARIFDRMLGDCVTPRECKCCIKIIMVESSCIIMSVPVSDHIIYKHRVDDQSAFPSPVVLSTVAIESHRLLFTNRTLLTIDLCQI